MTSATPLASLELPAVDDCWNRIGVKGDGSCVELKKVGHCHNCPVFTSAGQSLLERCPPREYLEDWTRRLAHDERAAADEMLALVLFRLGEEWFGLDVRCAVEAAPARPPRRIPHRSDRLLTGLVNIRGELHLCVSLRELLEIEPSASKPVETAPRLLVIEHRQQRWVFQADEILGVQCVPRSDIGSTPSTVSRSRSPCTHGVFVRDGHHVGLLDEKLLFDALKRRIG